MTITIETGLVTTSFEEGWEVRIRRGGRIGDIVKMLEVNGSEMRKGDDVLVVAGTNDMSDIRQMELGERIRYLERVENALTRTIKELKSKGINVFIMVPPPRKYGNEAVDLEVQKLIMHVASTSKIAFITAFHKGESD